jgi:competence ComEA-like helix-hairpin-helix protein
MALPIPGFGTAGLLFSDFGPTEYKEDIFILSHGFGLAEGIMFGYNLKSMSVKIQEYGSDTAFGIDMGLLARISDDLGLGAAAKNVNDPEISRGGEKLTQEFLTGLYYRPLPGLNFVFDLDKVLNKPVAIRIGTEFRIVDFFALRTGIQTNPSNYSFGFGVNYKTMYFDYAFTSHPTLDSLHIVTISAKFGGEGEASLKVKPKFERQRMPRAARRSAAAVGMEQEGMETAAPEGGKVNINTATADELGALPGISKTMAQKIVEFRDKNGLFKSIEDIKQIPRMTDRTYSKIESMITVTSAPVQEKGAEQEMKPEPAPVAAPAHGTTPPAASPAAPAAAPAKTDKEPAPEQQRKPKARAESEESSGSAAGKVNVNKASLPQLLDLGFTTIQAENILKYVREKGPFGSIDDIKKVPDIPPDIVDEIRDNITVR